MKHNRHLDQKLKNHFSLNKQALVLLGARQVGKTTILKKIFPDAKYLLVDEEPVLQAVEGYDHNIYEQLIGNSKSIILDELHLASDPGRCVKIIYDQMPHVKIVVTGSSALNIKNKTGESMAGRKIDYKIFPLTFSEYLEQNKIVDELDYKIFKKITGEIPQKDELKLFDLKRTLENVLIYGLYPELINSPRNLDYLENLADSVIFRDIIDLKLIEDRRLALDLLKLLAYQIGNLVNYSDISNRLNANIRTVKKYIEIFEQSFIIFRVHPYTRKGRNEIGKSPKIYFYDNGLRNALIGDFKKLSIRSDRGAVFENFIFTEVIKANSYLKSAYKINYWRLKNDSEVDLVLSRDDELIGCEIKYDNGSVTKSFSNRYPEAKTRLVTAKNFY